MLDDGRGSLARRLVDPPALRRDQPVALHLPYIAHLGEDAIVLRDGDVMASLMVQGAPADTADAVDLEDLAATVARVVARAGPDAAFYLHRVSAPAQPALRPVDPGHAFAHAVDARWQAALRSGALRARRTMLSVVIRPAQASGWIARMLGGGEARRREDLRRRRARLDETVDALSSALQALRPERLRRGDGRWLGVLRMAVSGRYAGLTPGMQFRLLADLVAGSRIDFDGDSFAVAGASAEDARIGAMFGVKRYPAATEAGLLDRLALPFDMAVTHSFTPVNPLKALERIQRTARQMSSAEDAAISLREQLEGAADDLASGRIGFGLHHMSVALFETDAARLDAAAAQLVSTAAGAGVELVRENLGARCTYFAQHPGNFAYRPRPAMISTRNFADLIALHGPATGLPAARTAWGEAVTALPTLTGEPYRFNFHLARSGEEPPLGHTAIFGRTGAGKSLLAAFLTASAMRLDPRVFVFDKDCGLEMPVRALGGAYAAVRLGAPSGFNPFAVETDDGGAAWLTDWVASVLLAAGGELTPVQSEALARAARANAAADPGLRTLSHFRSQLRAVDDDGDLHERLGEWDAGGRYGWLFGGAGPDRLDLDAAIVGFDLSEVLDAPRARTAWLTYVFRRIERLTADGKRTLLLLDEAWKLLDDPYFERRLKDWMLTMRKRNAAVVLLTQRVGHVSESAAGGAIFESLATTVAFPNARNTAAELAPLGLTRAETAFLTRSGEGQRLALVRSGDESAIVDLDLSALGPLLGVLGGGAGVRAPAGWRDDPDFWRAGP